MSQDNVKRIIFEWVTNTATSNASVAEINKLNAAFQKSIDGLGALNNFQMQGLREQFASSSAAIAALNTEIDKAKASGGLLGDLDRNAAAGFLQDLEKIQAREEQITAENEKQVELLNQQAQAAAQRASGGSVIRDIGLQNNALPDPAFGAFEGEDAATGGGGVGTGSIRSSLRALGGLLGPELGGGAARAAGQVVTLTAAFGGLGLGIGIIVGLLKLQQEQEDAGRKSIEDSTKAMKDEISAREALRQAIAGGSVGAINQQIAELNAQKADAQKLQTDLLTNLRSAAGQLHGEGRNPFEQVDAADRLVNSDLAGRVEELQKQTLAAEDSTAALNKQIADLNKQGREGAGVIESINNALKDEQERRKLGQSSDVKAATESIAGFTEDLGVNAIQIQEAQAAINDARNSGKEPEAQQLEVYLTQLKAQGKLTQSNLELYQSMLPVIEANAARIKGEQDALARANNTASAELEADKLTSDERLARVNELNREIEVYTQAKQASGLSADAIADFTSKIKALGSERDIVGSVVQSLADVQAAADALKKQNDELLDAEKLLGDATDKVTKAENDLQETRDEHSDKIDLIQEEEDSKLVAAQVKRDGDLGEARAKSQKKLAADLADIDDASDKRIAEQKRQNTRNIEKLVANNDQAAAITALEDQAAQIKEELKKRKEAEDKKTSDIDDSLKDQEETIHQRYNDQVTAAEEAARRSFAAEDVRYKKEAEQRQHALDEATVAQQNAANAVLAIQKSLAAQGLFQEEYYANGRLTIVDSNLQKIANLFNTRLAGIGNSIASLSGGTVAATSLRNATTSFAQGGGSSSAVQNALNAFYNAYSAPRTGTGRATATAFDDGGISMEAGMYRTGNVIEAHIPLDNPRAREMLGNISGDTHIHVYPSPGMDEAALAKLVAQQVNRQKPAIIREASDKMAKDYQKIRRAGRGN